MANCIHCGKDVAKSEQEPKDYISREHLACVVECSRRANNGLCLTCGDKLEDGSKVVGVNHERCDYLGAGKGFPSA